LKEKERIADSDWRGAVEGTGWYQGEVAEKIQHVNECKAMMIVAAAEAGYPRATIAVAMGMHHNSVDRVISKAKRGLGAYKHG